ncbi:MAG: hypothetical protein GEU79_03440 [Acidimicrobiia bacterium]|nr:hypothetical protein [Acidimicrobiia bacterium]
MSTVGQVRLIQTETSLMLLQQVLREHLRVLTNPTDRLRLNHLPGFGPTDPQQIRACADYLRMVGLVEAFTDSVYQSLVESAASASSEVVTRALDEHLVASSLSWRNRREAFQHIHGILLPRSPRWKDLEGGVLVVRNAIAHGLGELTRKQRRKTDIYQRLRQINVRLIDGQVRLEEDSLRVCAEISRSYIEWLDAQSRSVVA